MGRQRIILLYALYFHGVSAPELKGWNCALESKRGRLRERDMRQFQDAVVVVVVLFVIGNAKVAYRQEGRK